ncbi:ribosomal protein S30-domain-containing protein, partial [Boletus edulis BED1]
ADRRGNYTVLQSLTRRLFQPRQHGESIPSSQVKSQTPKVEKQEEEKAPTGRAKKRELYNRRFVNVMTIPGENQTSRLSLLSDL